jgi:hypothetical protein
VAVGVVVAVAHAELGDPAREVRSVRPDELDHGLGLAKCLDRVGEGTVGDFGEIREAAQQVDQVVAAAVLAE